MRLAVMIRTRDTRGKSRSSCSWCDRSSVPHNAVLEDRKEKRTRASGLVLRRGSQTGRGAAGALGAIRLLLPTQPCSPEDQREVETTPISDPTITCSWAGHPRCHRRAPVISFLSEAPSYLQESPRDLPRGTDHPISASYAAEVILLSRARGLVSSSHENSYSPH